MQNSFASQTPQSPQRNGQFSTTGSDYNTTSTQTLKGVQQLLHTEEEAIEAIEHQSVGLSIELAGKFSENKKNIISAIDFKVSAVESNTQRAIVTAFVARHVANCIDLCLQSGGDCLTKVVLSNFQLQTYITNVTSQRIDLDEEIALKESDIRNCQVSEPSRDYHEDVCKLQKARQQNTLYNRYKTQFQERVSHATTRRQAQQQIEPELFVNSEEYATYIQELRMADAEAELNLSQNFVTEREKYVKTMQKQVNLKNELEELKRKRTNANVQEQVLTGLTAIIGLILTKLRAALTNYPEVTSLLVGRVNLANQLNIVDPLNNGNLCGIYYILHREYNQATLPTFFTHFLELVQTKISEYDSNNKIGTATNLVNSKLKIWQQLKLFEFMDLDTLFTVILLNAFAPGTDFRHQLTLEVLKFTEQLNQQDSAYNSDSMPLYTFTQQYIHTYTQTKSMTTDDTRGRRNQNSQYRSFNSTTQNRQSGVETAAAATTIVPGDAIGPYNCEITKDHKLYITDVKSGHRYPYTATMVPGAYKGKCADCKMYGHLKEYCKQEKK